MTCLKNPNDIKQIKYFANKAYVDSVERFKNENLKCPDDNPDDNPKQFSVWESPNPKTFKTIYFLPDLTQKLREAFPFVHPQTIVNTAKPYTTSDTYSFNLQSFSAGTDERGLQQFTYSLTAATDEKVKKCKLAMELHQQPNTMTTAEAEAEAIFRFKRDALKPKDAKRIATRIATRRAAAQAAAAATAAQAAPAAAAAAAKAAAETQEEISSFYFNLYNAQLTILQSELRKTSSAQVQQLLSSAQMKFNTQFRNAVKDRYPTEQEQEQTSKIITEILEKNKSIMLCKLQVNGGELYHSHQGKWRKVNGLVNSLDPLTFYLL